MWDNVSMVLSREAAGAVLRICLGSSRAGSALQSVRKSCLHVPSGIPVESGHAAKAPCAVSMQLLLMYGKHTCPRLLLPCTHH